MRVLLSLMLLVPLLARAQKAPAKKPKTEVPKADGPVEPPKVELKPELRIDGKAVTLRTIRLSCEGTAYCEVELFDVATPCGETRPMRGQIFALPAVVGPELRLVPGGAPRIDLNDAEGANIELGRYDGAIRVTAVDLAKHKLTFAVDLTAKQNVFRGSYTGEICP